MNLIGLASFLCSAISGPMIYAMRKTQALVIKMEFTV